MKKNRKDNSKSKEIRLNKALDEAAKTLNRKGITQTSLTEISKKLGVSRSALYYYFQDQEDLVFQCYRRTCERLTHHLNQSKQLFTETFDVIDSFVESSLGESESEFAVLSESAFLRNDQKDVIFKLYDGLRNNLAAIIEVGIKKGEIRNCHKELNASAIIGLISWVQKILPEKRFPLIDLIETVKSLLRYGVAANRVKPIEYTPFKLSPMKVLATQAFDQQVLNIARQEAFLCVASWLFNLKGVDATSLDEIANSLGVSKKLIYHHIGDKQRLVSECYRRAYNFYEEIGSLAQNYKGLRIDALSASAHALAEASIRTDICPFRPFTGLDGLTAAEKKKLRVADLHLTATYVDIYNLGLTEGSLRNFTQGTPAILRLLPGTVEWLPKWLESFTDTERIIAPREMTELYRIGLRPI